MASFDYRNQLLPRERPGLLSGSAAFDARMRAEPPIDEQAAMEPLPSWMKWGSTAALSLLPASRIPSLARFTAQGAKEIWQSPIGDAVKRYGWDALSQGVGWRLSDRLRKSEEDSEKEREPLPIGGDPLAEEFLGPDTFAPQQTNVVDIEPFLKSKDADKLVVGVRNYVEQWLQENPEYNREPYLPPGDLTDEDWGTALDVLKRYDRGWLGTALREYAGADIRDFPGGGSAGASQVDFTKLLDSLGFGSKSIEAARNLQDKSYTVQELRKIINPISRKGQPKPSPFSLEELKWMGVSDYLQAMENSGQQVSKSDLLKYMLDNRVMIREDAKEAAAEDARPIEVDWDEMYDFYEHDKPAWSEYLQLESEEHRENIANDVVELQEHFEQGGQTHDIPGELLASLGTIFDMAGLDLVEVTHDEWQERNEDSLMDNITTLAENRAAYYYHEGGSQHWVQEAHIGQGDHYPQGDLTYRIEGNDDYGWTVTDPQGNQATEAPPAGQGQRGNRQTRTFDTRRDAENYVELDALESGYLRDEDDEGTTVAGPGTGYEQYNLYGLEGMEDDSYQEIVMAYDQWGPLVGGNYPRGGLGSTADDSGAILYSEPHYQTKNAFLHIRLHDRQWLADQDGNIKFRKGQEGQLPNLDAFPHSGQTTVSVRILDEIQSTWNTQGRERGWHHPNKWTVFNPATGEDLGWYDTEEEMLEAHPNLIEDVRLGELAGRRRANLEVQGEDVLDAPEWVPLATVDESKLIDYQPPRHSQMLRTMGSDRSERHQYRGGVEDPSSERARHREGMPTTTYRAESSTEAYHPLMDKGEGYMAGFKRVLMKAKQDGVDYIFIPGGEEQAARYSFAVSTNPESRYQKMLGFYDVMFPRLINKFLKKVGAEKLQQIGLDRDGNLTKGWILKMTPALLDAIMSGLNLYSKVIKPKAGLLGRREEGLLAYA